MAALLLALALSGHSGGTDANGCHVDSSTGVRHCHNNTGGGGGTSTAEESAQTNLYLLVCLGVCGGVTAAFTLLAGSLLAAGLTAWGILVLRDQQRAQRDIERPPVTQEDLLRPRKPSDAPQRPAPDRERQEQMVQQGQDQGISLEECWKMVR